MQTGFTALEGRRQLIVRLGPSEFGIDVMKVREIAETQPLTRVPGMPKAVRGVINLHGKVVPVMDLRARMGVVEEEASCRTCLVVVQANERTVALVVDEVVEVLRTSAGEGGKTLLEIDGLLQPNGERV